MAGLKQVGTSLLISDNSTVAAMHDFDTQKGSWLWQLHCNSFQFNYIAVTLQSPATDKLTFLFAIHTCMLILIFHV